MLQRNFTVTAKSGLHARPAGLIAQVVGNSEGQVSIGRPGEESVDAASMLTIMGLGLSEGDEVSVTVDASNDEHVMKLLEAIICPSVVSNA